MKHITVGVAGHVDHGKTALVRALTGMETDRLAEEQSRGMSIVLGFAHLNLPEGDVDFIDVPGHEKFIHTMIAGAAGVEAVLLVVAANEGIRPQTAEHAALSEMLGVKQGIIVIAKSDLMPDTGERLLAETEVREGMQETFLKDAPVVWASSVTQEGLAAVRDHLRALLAQASAATELPFCFLPVDRVFTMTGHGTVVTGTLRRGVLQAGQGVQILPGGLRAEVRGLEVHGAPVTLAQPGWRVAVNLRGVKKDEIARGHALATPDVFLPTRLLDTSFRLLPSASRPLRQGQTVRVHMGAAEFSARAHLLDCDELLPGETGFVQFRLKVDIFTPALEPFVARTLSPVETIGGGVIVDASSARHARFDNAVLARLRIYSQGTTAERVEAKLREAGAGGCELRRLGVSFSLTGRQVDEAVAMFPAVLCSGGVVLHGSVFQETMRKAMDSVRAFHLSHPTLPGMPREELRRRLPRTLATAAFARVLEELERRRNIRLEGGVVCDFGWTAGAGLTPKEQEIAQKIEAHFREAGMQPPNLPDVLGQDKRWKVLFHYLVKQQVLVETIDQTNNRTVVFHRDALTDAERQLAVAMTGADGLTVSQINAALGLTRKYSIPLLEHFDAQGVTRRVGNVRVWNK